MSHAQHAPTKIKGFSPIVQARGGGLKILENQRLQFSWEDRCRHILADGKTGSGKTTGLILPFCFSDIEDPERTVIFLDAQGTEAARIIRHAQAVRGKNARIIYINPQDPEYSVFWNPFAGLSKRYEAFSVADSMCAALKQGRDESDYFRSQATKVLTAKIRGLNALAEGNATGGEMLRLLDGGAATLYEFAKKAAAAGLPDLYSFASQLSSANHNDQTTASFVGNLLLPWNDEKVAEVTALSEFDFATLDLEPTVLIYAIPEHSVGRLRPLTNAFLHRLFHFVMERADENGGALARPWALFLDEFASAIGEIPFFPEVANTVRKRGLAIFAAVQTLGQIDDVYRSSARSLLAAFNHYIYVPPVEWKDAVHASEMSGQITVEKCTTSNGFTPLSFQTVERARLLPTQIASPPDTPALGPRMTFFLANSSPFLGWIKPIYQREEYRESLQKGTAFPLPRRERPGRKWAGPS